MAGLVLLWAAALCQAGAQRSGFKCFAKPLPCFCFEATSSKDVPCLFWKLELHRTELCITGVCENCDVICQVLLQQTYCMCVYV